MVAAITKVDLEEDELSDADARGASAVADLEQSAVADRGGSPEIYRESDELKDDRFRRKFQTKKAKEPLDPPADSRRRRQFGEDNAPSVEGFPEGPILKLLHERCGAEDLLEYVDAETRRDCC